MQKCHLELLDVLRAEIADLYQLRVQDDARLRCLERMAWRSVSTGPNPSAMPPIDHEPTDRH